VKHTIVNKQEFLKAHAEFLQAEKELTRQHA
jgi:predicted dithiol-disulfide oxidoreductase (DUF899 family)